MSAPLGPADVSSIYACLQAALQEGSRKQAEEALAAFETRVGFCSCLLEIISKKELDQQGSARWLAAVYFKNSVNRYWRARRETPGIGEDEKPLLRAKLLELISDENNQVSVQLAVLVAKIARIDYPRTWPELFPSLVLQLQSSDPLVTQRAFLTLSHVLKELATKRLGVDQRAFAQVTSQLFEPTWTHWMQDTSALLRGLSRAASAAGLSPATSAMGGTFAAAAAGGGPVGGSPGGGATGGGWGEEEGRELMRVCERWRYCLKSLRCMLVFGFPSDVKAVQEVTVLHTVVPAFLEASSALLNYWSLLHSNALFSALHPFLSKAAVKLVRALTAAQETHPFSFASQNVLQPCLEFAFTHTTASQGNGSADAATADLPLLRPASITYTPNGDGSSGGGKASGGSSPSPSHPPITLNLPAVKSPFGAAEGDGRHELFLVQCMLLLQGSLGCVSYRSPAHAGHVVGATLPSLEEARGKLGAMGKQQLTAFFTAERAAYLARFIILNFFVLTPTDLEDWDADGETWFHEQGSSHWKDKLRPCAEALLLQLFEQHKDVLCPLVLDMLRQAIQSCPPPASPDADVAVSPPLLLKDACYAAVGVACYDLHNLVDFKAWFFSSLAAELGSQHPNGRILRRRAAWLTGQWENKVKDELRSAVYHAVVALLGDADIVVQLASCTALRCLIDDVQFYDDQFLPFLEPSLRLLFGLAQRVVEFDSQLLVFTVVSIIIERMGDKVVPHAQQILSFFPQMWERSEGQSLLRIQLLQAMQKMVTALNQQSPAAYPLLMPLLRHSTDVNQPDELNLLEDGLQLWHVTLRHSPAITPDLLSLFPHLLPVMERSFEHLPVAVGIMESYVLFGGKDFLQQHGTSLAAMVNNMAGNIKEKGMMPVLNLIDLLIVCHPAEAPAALQEVLLKLLLILIGPTDYSDVVRGTAATVLARVLLQNTLFFSQMMTSEAARAALQQQSAAKGGLPPLLLFVDTWLDKVDSVSVATKRRLSSLALASLLTLPEPRLLDRVDLIISACTSSLSDDLAQSSEGSSISYDSWATGSTEFSNHEGQPMDGESIRRMQVRAIDPVNQVSYGSFLKEKLLACASLHGEVTFQQAMARVPPAIVSQLQSIP